MKIGKATAMSYQWPTFVLFGWVYIPSSSVPWPKANISCWGCRLDISSFWHFERSSVYIYNIYFCLTVAMQIFRVPANRIAPPSIPSRSAAARGLSIFFPASRQLHQRRRWEWGPVWNEHNYTYMALLTHSFQSNFFPDLLYFSMLFLHFYDLNAMPYSHLVLHKKH